MISALLAMLCGVPARGWAAPGDLDPTFDGDGIVVTPVGMDNSSGSAVAIQADGKIVVSGTAYDSDVPLIAVVRYNPDGTLDPSFAGDGKEVLTTSDYSYALGVAIQADGRILVTGVWVDSILSGGSDVALVRYKPDGTRDPSFDGDGIVVTPVHGDDFGYDVAVQADGKIVVGGTTIGVAAPDFIVVRYNPDGTLDTNFNGNGKVQTTVGSGTNQGNSVAIQADGKIVVSGFASNGNNTDIAVVRYNPNGTLDTSFDGDGKVLTPVGTGTDSGFDVAIQNDGKIVVVGGAYLGNFEIGPEVAIAVVRYNADGTLDTTFDGDGKLRTAVEPPDSSGFFGTGAYGSGVAIQADGKIVVSGQTYDSDDRLVAVVRYNPDGTLDSSFNGDGRTVTQAGTRSSGSDVAIQADGRIVVGGYADNGSDFDFVALRYLGDPVVPTPTPSLCPDTVRSGCRTAQQALLVLKDHPTDDAKDELVWKWLNGEATTQDDFTPSVQLCIYAGAPPVLLNGIALPIATTYWSPIGDKGWKFSDPSGEASGILKAVLKGGAAEKARIVLRGKGANLPDLPGAALPLPLTVQLQQRARFQPITPPRPCFESVFSSAISNEADEFKAKLP